MTDKSKTRLPLNEGLTSSNLNGALNKSVPSGETFKKSLSSSNLLVALSKPAPAVAPKPASAPKGK